MKLLLFLVLMISAHAESVFKKSPYLFIGKNQTLYLSFELEKAASLDFEVIENQNNSILKKDKYFKKGFYKYKVGKLQCDKSFALHFNENFQDSFIETYSYPCDKSESAKVLFISDTQYIKGRKKAGIKRHRQLATTVEKHLKNDPVSLILHAGDVVYSGGKENEWQDFFNSAKLYLNHAPIASAVGNHEYRGEVESCFPSNFYYYLRGNEKEKLGNMAVHLPQISFLVFNSNISNLTKDQIKIQENWLKNQLLNAKRNGRKTALISHHTSLSSNFVVFTKEARYIKKSIIPIVEKYQVTPLILAGHVHQYERSQKNNITYINAGSGGGIYNPFLFFNKYSKVLHPFRTTFSYLEINNLGIEVRTFDTKDRYLDHHFINF